MKRANECKLIRFIDSQYNDLFYLPDGELLEVTYSDGEKKQHKCQYIDETHVKVGRESLHICQLAETMERNGHCYKPTHSLADVVLDSPGIHQKEMYASRSAMRAAFWSWRFLIRDEWDGEKDVARVSMQWEDIHSEKASIKRLRESVQIANRLRADWLTSVQTVKELCAQRACDKPHDDESFYEVVVLSDTLVHYMRIHIDRQVIVTVYCCRRSHVDHNNDYVDCFYAQFSEDKYTVDEVEGIVINEYFNPDSEMGGELIQNRLSFEQIVEATQKAKRGDAIDESAFWNHLDMVAGQTSTSVTEKAFRAEAVSFVNEPATFWGQDANTMNALVALVNLHIEKHKSE